MIRDLPLVMNRTLPGEVTDPRRQLIAESILYGGIFIVVAGSVWLRHH
jgi:hypothetical protein